MRTHCNASESNLGTILGDNERTCWAMGVEDGREIEYLDVRVAGVLDLGDEKQLVDGLNDGISAGKRDDKLRSSFGRRSKTTDDQSEYSQGSEQHDVRWGRGSGRFSFQLP